MSLFDYQGNIIGGISTGKIKVPPIFDSVLSTDTVYTSLAQGDVQSGCANGNVVWFANITNNTLYRYDIRTQTLTSAVLSGIGHANGMTYCDKDNCVYIDTMNGTQGTVLKVGADDLTLKSTITHSYLHSSIAWNRSTQEFYAKQSQGTVLVFDYNWNYLWTFTLSVIPTGTNQSIETDGSFLYFCWCEGTSYYTDSAQHIYVYTLDGVFLKDVKPYASELESVAYNGYGDYYLITNKGSSNYGIIKKVIPYSNIDVPTTNGTYVLKATVASGKITYAWVSE